MSTNKSAILRLSELGKEILLAEAGKPDTVQVLRVGAWLHEWYGPMLITQQVLSDMVRNFDDKVRRQDINFDFFHESDKEASGWPTRLYLSDDSQELWAEVKWTPKAKRMLADKEVRYFSADFSFEWTDPETGVTYKNVLFGGGLVNRPFVKDMQPVVELNERVNEMTLAELQAQVKTLGEQLVAKDADISAKSEEVKTLGEKVKSLGEEVITLKGEKAKAAKEAADAAKVAKFEEMVRNGKACPAQKEAFLADDLCKFAELAQPINLNEGGGQGGKVPTNVSGLSDEEKAMCKKLNLSEEDYAKYNQGK